jgi:uncharacterized delta-60 repeat protein
MKSSAFDLLGKPILAFAWLVAVAPAVALDPPPSPPALVNPLNSLTMPDGRKLIAAYFHTAPQGYSSAIWRYNADGTPDSSFNGDGFAAIPIWGYYEGAGPIVLQPDGKIVTGTDATDPSFYLDRSVTADTCHPAGCYYFPALVRLNADGSIDTSFNGNGRIAIAIGDINSDPRGVGDFGTLTNIALQPDGKIVIYEGKRPTARVNADGTLDTTFVGDGPPAREYFIADAQGLWYVPEEAGEAGWGIYFAQQGEVIFAIWFTYDHSGGAWWLSAALERAREGVYTGQLYETHGPALDVSFEPKAVSATMVGEITLAFTDRNHAKFDYTAKGFSGTKTITRQVFGPREGCSFGTLRDLARATNYQDLWYADPPESEAGWGLAITHQGDTIFALWLTYDFNSKPLWLSGTAVKGPDGGYAGTLRRTWHTPFNEPWDDYGFAESELGPFTLTFSDGDHARFHYELMLDSSTGPSSVNQTKAITRQVFREPGTTCR